MQLAVLDASGNRLGHALADLLDAALRPPLRRLYLSNCGGTATLTPSAAVLLDNSALLQVLDLSWNQLDAPGCRQLADALRWNRALVRLDLSHCALGSPGAAYLGEALSDNSCAPACTMSNGSGDL
jgi:Ran GTPase-activating protein (RanGAP) involved in mRNA processing and transport